MRPHAYFLIDSGTLEDTKAARWVEEVVMRVVVSLSGDHDGVTWNYEVTDLGAGQREPRTGRRRVAERRMVDTRAVAELGTELRGHSGGNGGEVVLETLTRRLMCLEADVEWGDPALMRSPPRGIHGTRTWADATRLAAPIMQRNRLIVVGRRVPGTLDEVHRFVNGGSESLGGMLEAVRDGLVGNGLWESYARKRVGVSLIHPGTSSTGADPVARLIGVTFSACFEALGGTIVALPPGPLLQVLPFSACIPVQAYTYPAWSRKLAREISAVAECFDRQNHVEEEWVVDGPSESSSVRLVSSVSGWMHGVMPRMTATRVLRRYSVAELVALAGASCDAQQGVAAHGSAVAWCPADRWHRMVELAPADPVCCEVRGGSLGNDVMLVRSETDDGSYVVVVPGPGVAALVYAVDAQAAHDIETRMNEPHQTDMDAGGAAFDPAWLERWACIDGDLSVVPADTCPIAVHFDTLDAEDRSGAVVLGEIESPDEPSTETSKSVVDGPSTETSSKPPALESWYEGTYLRMIPEPAPPPLGSAVDALLELIDMGITSVAQVASTVLLGSRAIEEAFDAQNEATTQLAKLRHDALQSIDGEPAQRLWQVHECQLQILLHLVCLANTRDGDAEMQERLTEHVRDLAELLCIWASVDGLAVGDVAGDLAAAFVGGPDVSRFAGILGDTVEELRIQCGWVPPPPPPTSKLAAAAATEPRAADSADGRRRKGTTPRRISRRMDQRSEVIVHQRSAAAAKQHVSSRRIARHLDELISGETSRGAVSGRADLRMPDHLVRQIKSEVVMTVRSSSAGQPSLKKPPEFAIRQCTAPAPAVSPEQSTVTPRNKRQRLAAHAASPGQGSPSILFASPSQRTASHYIFASDESSDDEDRSQLLGRQSPIEQQMQESHRSLEF